VQRSSTGFSGTSCPWRGRGVRGPRRDRVRRFLILGVLAAGLASAGCGQGDTKTRDAKATYVARADAICTVEQAKRERLESRVADLAPITANETHEVAGLLRREADSRRTEVRRLRVLGPVPADPRTVASLLSFLGDEIAHLEGWARAYDMRNEQAIRAFQIRIAEDSEKAAAVARHYGFKVCGSPGNGNPGNLTRFR
jgi:hypothetical protein